MRFYLSKTRLIIIGISALIIIGTVLVLIFGFQGIGSPPPKVTLEFWNVFDNSDTWKPFLKTYRELHPNVRIIYKQIPFEEYETTLIDALAAGKGPDIFTIHNTWLARWQDKLEPIPQLDPESRAVKVLRLRPFFHPTSFSQTFMDVVSQDFRRGDQLYAVPLYVDTLALYYNKDIFASAGIALPPQTWAEFLDMVPKLRRFDNQGRISRAAAAIGTARNINRSTDILSLLMLQNGTLMSDAARGRILLTEIVRRGKEGIKPGVRALEFYTNFADPSQDKFYTWNLRQDYSIDSFFLGRSAMMVNYAFHISTVRSKAPYLNFGIAPMPQVDLDAKVNYANYWGLTVSKISPKVNQYYGWDFIHFMASREQAKQYLLATGEPTSRLDLVDWQRNDPDLGAYAVQGLSARSWWQPDNRVVEQALADAIEAVNRGEATPEQALERAEARIQVLVPK
jgi:multiple sugar transport system substrate-binding protein